MMMQAIIDFVEEERTGARPTLTLSYAQSIDGSLTLERGKATAISGPESMKLTHQLRAAHDAIMVGIGTVLVDDPSLNVRLIEGRNPQAIILDSSLRFPKNAKMLQGGRRPWIFCTKKADASKIGELEDLGMRVFPVEENDSGRITIGKMFEILGDEGINKIMLEGGAGVIAAFLTAKMVDQAVITIAPKFLGGLNVLGHGLRGLTAKERPHLERPMVEQFGEDLILWGRVIYS